MGQDRVGTKHRLPVEERSVLGGSDREAFETRLARLKQSLAEVRRDYDAPVFRYGVGAFLIATALVGTAIFSSVSVPSVKSVVKFLAGRARRQSHVQYRTANWSN